MLVQNSISALELRTCLMIWICSVFYSIYCFAGRTNRVFQDYEDEYSDFSDGWLWLSRKKDSADNEWEMNLFLVRQLYPWAIIHVVGSEILRKYASQNVLLYWQISMSALYMAKHWGLFLMGVFLVQPVLFRSITVFLCKNKLTLWIWSGAILTVLSVYVKSELYERGLMDYFEINPYHFSSAVVNLFWLNLKCISFSSDSVSQKQDGRQDENGMTTLDFFAYCFHFPTVFGPFIPYKDYKHCRLYTADLQKRLLVLVFDVCRCIFWSLFMQLALHFIYANVASYHPEWLQTLDAWSLCGYGYAMSHYFHLKYVVWYGLTLAFSKFENIPTPALPICIARVHLYSDMWRYFDVGLHNFLARYIYIPSMKTFNIKFVSALFCFVFIYMWHGTAKDIFIWTVCNFIAIQLEVLGEMMGKTYLEEYFHKIGPRWARRLTCLAASPLLGFSIVSNFYFFGGLEVGNIFKNKFLRVSYQTAALMAILYCCCQVSTELRPKKIKKQEKKH